MDSLHLELVFIATCAFPLGNSLQIHCTNQRWLSVRSGYGINPASAIATRAHCQGTLQRQSQSHRMRPIHMAAQVKSGHWLWDTRPRGPNFPPASPPIPNHSDLPIITTVRSYSRLPGSMPITALSLPPGLQTHTHTPPPPPSLVLQSHGIIRIEESQDC